MIASKKTFAANIARIMSSLAMSCVVAVLAVVALVVVTAEDTRAEGGRVSLQAGQTASFASGWLGDVASRPSNAPRPRGTGAVAIPRTSGPTWISRRPVTPHYSAEVSANQAFLEMSKLVFPLLVSDLTVGGPERSIGIMTGSPVGAR